MEKLFLYVRYHVPDTRHEGSSLLSARRTSRPGLSVSVFLSFFLFSVDLRRTPLHLAAFEGITLHVDAHTYAPD